MPWKVAGVMEQRLRFVGAAERQERCIAALCREYGVSRTTGHLWVKRYREGGAAAVADRSRRPHRSPGKSADETERRLVEMRRERPDWGALKLAHLYREQHPEGEAVAARTVHRILARHGLIEPGDQRRPATKRFERGGPNELWQMDFKGPQGFNPEGSPVGPLSILDDHSRYLLALEHLGSTKSVGVRQTLERTFRQVGVPEELLVDHGTPWWNAASPWGLTELAVWIMRQGVRLIQSGIRHPQTQGKVEGMHRVLQRAISRRKQDPQQQGWLEEFRQEYNHVRPHQGIGMARPAERWRPSPRAYQPEPKPWEYPAHQTVVRLAGEGQLWWKGRRYETSGALRRQTVGLEQIGDRVLVYYCGTPLRELDLRTGASTPITTDLKQLYAAGQGKGPQAPAPLPGPSPRFDEKV